MASLLLGKGIADCVHIMPCYQSPHKLGKVYTEASHRLEMVRRALRDAKLGAGVEVDDYEVRGGEVSFTYKTLAYLKEKYADDVILVIGADQWVNFDRWVKYDEILKNHQLVVFKRGDDVVEETEGVCVVEYENLASSTAIRAGHNWDEMLTASVIEYIKEFELYSSTKGLNFVVKFII